VAPTTVILMATDGARDGTRRRIRERARREIQMVQKAHLKEILTATEGAL
jgi:hypothetical protein